MLIMALVKFEQNFAKIACTQKHMEMQFDHEILLAIFYCGSIVRVAWLLTEKNTAVRNPAII